MTEHNCIKSLVKDYREALFGTRLEREIVNSEIRNMDEDDYCAFLDEMLLFGAQSVVDDEPPRYDPTADRWLWLICAASAALVIWIIALAIGVRP